MPMRDLLLLVLLLAWATPGCGRVEVRSAGTGVSGESARPLVTGVRYGEEWRPEGPWAIHWLEIALDACGIEVRTAKGGDRIVGVERTSELAARGALPGRAVLAAVNADFFRFDPLGVPEGPQIAQGIVVAGRASFGPPVAERFDVPQPVYGVSESSGWFVGEIGFEGSLRVNGRPGSVPLGRVNAPPAPDSVALYNAFASPPLELPEAPVHAAARLRALATGEGDAALVVAVDSLAIEVPMSADGPGIAGSGPAADWIRSLAPGDTVRWSLDIAGGSEGVVELVGGFPLLLQDGSSVLDRVPRINEGFAFGPHPRTAVGIREDGALLLVTVDGRQPGYSEGMTLPELTELLLEMGVRDALNLDGGGSTAFVLEGELVNRPSDADGERAVSNALLVLGPPPGACPP